MFTTYVAAWLWDILVESSTGNRPHVTGLSNVTQTPAVRWVKTRELPLDFIKATSYTALTQMIRVQEIIKVKFWDVDMLLAASLMIPCWKWIVPFSFVSRETNVSWKLFLCHFLKEKQLCCKNSFFMSCVYVLVEECFYSANIGVIIDDSFLEANCVIVVYLCNGERTHKL